MCPKCHRFTNAPVGQKRRRCSYCGKIIDISKAAVAMFDDQHAATKATKEFNASGSDEFHKAVERSRERVQELVPTETISAEDLSDDSEESELPAGKTKRLMTLLEREAREKSCSLDRIEELSPDYQLEWDWVEEQLTKLGNRGTLVFPRPWSVKLVGTSSDGSEEDSREVDVSKDILRLLKEQDGRLSVRKLIAHYGKKSVSENSVFTSLDRLMNSGDIYQPKPGLVSLVE
jgi:hypothetical protein